MSTSQETQEFISSLKAFLSVPEKDYTREYLDRLEQVSDILYPAYITALKKKIERLEKENSILRFTIDEFGK